MQLAGTTETGPAKNAPRGKAAKRPTSLAPILLASSALIFLATALAVLMSEGAI